MDPEQRQFLSLVKPPARQNANQAAWYMGFQTHEISILVAVGLLKPLGNPPVNGVKYFATSSLDELREDPKWLARASDALHRYWKEKNARKANGAFGRIPSGSAKSTVDEPV